MSVKFIDNPELFVTEIKSIEAFHTCAHQSKKCAFQGIDFRKLDIDWTAYEVKKISWVANLTSKSSCI